MTNLLGGIPSNAPIYANFVRNDRTAGDLTLNSTTWADVDNGLDATVAAETGDWLLVGLSAFWGNQASVGFLDAVSLVAGAPVNSITLKGAPNNSAFGVLAWGGAVSQQGYAGGAIPYQVQAGDLSTGNVTLRLRYRTFSAVNKTLGAQALIPLTFWVVNMRQP